MALFDSKINIIRGYIPNNVGATPWYVQDYFYYKTVMDAVIACLNELARRAEIDISDDIRILNTRTFGRDIRKDLYSICSKICIAMGKPRMLELYKIKTAHYGRDLRDPLADIFIKLGILEDHFDPTDEDDYIYDNGEIIYYKGTKRSPMIPNILGNEFVTTITSTAFGTTDIEGVIIPEGVTTIE